MTTAHENGRGEARNNKNKTNIAREQNYSQFLFSFRQSPSSDLRTSDSQMRQQRQRISHLIILAARFSPPAAMTFLHMRSAVLTNYPFRRGFDGFCCFAVNSKTYYTPPPRANYCSYRLIHAMSSRVTTNHCSSSALIQIECLRLIFRCRRYVCLPFTNANNEKKRKTRRSRVRQIRLHSSSSVSGTYPVHFMHFTMHIFTYAVQALELSGKVYD